jgi:putative membrane protein (TIGR04086 family)
MVVVKNVVLSYVLSFLGVLIVAFLLYKIGISEKVIQACILFLYGGSTFLAGYLSGQKLKKMKFLWGLAAGVLYFAVLVILSAAKWGVMAFSGREFWIGFIFCTGGGMLGGMFSS